jgi:DNA invertase Pin-like site-specific DNA recombinase
MDINSVIYSRVSTSEQDNERQINELKEYISYKKYKLLGVFEEKVSGAKKAADRIEFSKMLKFIEGRDIHHVLIWEISRLGRNMVDIVNTIEYFTERKINIYSKKEGLNTLNSNDEKEPITSLLIGILSSFSELERQTIKDRSKSGIRQNVVNGGSGTGVLKPYGYMKVDSEGKRANKEAKRLAVDPEEAAIIKDIFQKFLNGLGTKQLANYLNSQGIPTRFNKIFGEKEVKLQHYNKKGSDFKWVDGTVYSILKNPIYKGKRLHKGETFKIDAIIDEATFDKVQLLLKSKFNCKDINRKYTNIFKDKIKCGKCGSSYFLHKRADNCDNAYKCLSKRYNRSCGNPSISIDKLNNAIYKMIVTHVMESAMADKQKTVKSIETKLTNNQIGIDNTIKALEKNNRQEKNLIQLRIDESISIENFTSLYNNISSEKTTLTNQLTRLQQEKDELERLSKAVHNDTKIEHADVNLFKEYVTEFVEYIKVDELPKGTYDFIDKEYTTKKDIIVIITIKLLLNDFLYKTVVSQRSNIQYMFVRLKKEDQYRTPQPHFRSQIENDIKI